MGKCKLVAPRCKRKALGRRKGAGLPAIGILAALADNLGSVRDIVNTSSVVVDHIVCNSFGNVVYESGTVAHWAGFAGYHPDANSVLDYADHRWYDPAVGRWISEDPLGFGGGDTNVSRYVGNDTTVATDPTGLQGRGVGPPANGQPPILPGSSQPPTVLPPSPLNGSPFGPSAINPPQPGLRPPQVVHRHREPGRATHRARERAAVRPRRRSPPPAPNPRRRARPVALRQFSRMPR